MSKLLRYHGHIIIVGIFARPAEVDLHRFFWQELRMSGARLYSSEDFDEALALAATGTMPLERLITNTFELGQIQMAFESLCNSPTSVKTLVHCSI